MIWNDLKMIENYKMVWFQWYYNKPKVFLEWFQWYENFQQYQNQQQKSQMVASYSNISKPTLCSESSHYSNSHFSNSHYSNSYYSNSNFSNSKEFYIMSRTTGCTKKNAS